MNLSGPQRGVTLIEVLVVIAILAILAGVVVFAVNSGSGTSSRDDCIANGGQWFDGYTVSRSGCLYSNSPDGDR